jgi:release factor glutamine methyltransferase
MGFTFSVDKRALIPRPETETLVGLVAEAFPTDTEATIIDIGTGSGCIAISLALLLLRSSLHAVDISEDALALARENAERHGVNRRITFHCGDACSALPLSLEGRVNAIVSNPPYITDAEYATLDPGITDFEPSSALKGGADGLEIFRRVAAGAARYLAPGGLIAVEIGSTQAEAAAGILGRTESFVGIMTAADLSGRNRVVTGRKKP